jgi:CHAT domain-containing protein
MATVRALTLAAMILAAVGAATSPGAAEGICVPAAALAPTAGMVQPIADRGGASTRAKDETEAAIAAAERDRRAGRVPAALQRLEAALRRAEAGGDAVRIARVAGSLGVALQAAGAPAEAERALERSLELARESDAPAIEAATLANLANLWAAGGETARAVDAYDRAATLAARAGADTVAARARVNAAASLVKRGSPEPARERLDAALDHLDAVSDRAARAEALVTAGVAARELATASGHDDDLLRAHDVLAEAARLAGEAEDSRLGSYAAGELASLYLSEGRDEEALVLTRRALFLAQAASSPEALYRWQWQLGRLRAGRGEREAAVDAYRDAIATLRSIRTDLVAVDPATGRSRFRETIGEVHLELADLLLRPPGPGEAVAPADLVEARAVVEQLKTVELVDYFEDECVAVLQGTAQPIEDIDPQAAVLYPVILPDRLELLLSIEDRMLHATVDVPATTVGAEATAFRGALQNIYRDPLPGAQKLYEWLVAPFRDALAARAIDTLVFVPDGALRQIPLAALHDGERFLVETYAVALAPGMSLLGPRPTSEFAIRPLVGGLVGELPAVGEELRAIAQLYEGTTLEGSAFTTDRLRAELQRTDYTVVHLASHAQFSPEPEDTFVRVADGRLSMDALERLIAVSRFRERPVELLTLSACETAAGNERAALGLAGLAIKAGARSAMATLMPVDDVAALQVTREFYRNLAEPGTSKARALQQAQIRLVHTAADPVLWAPFVLIGNWL